jgi:hypothetical protein
MDGLKVPTTDLPTEGIAWGKPCNGETTWHAYLGRMAWNYLCGREMGSHFMADSSQPSSCLRCLYLANQLTAQAMTPLEPSAQPKSSGDTQ